MFNQFSRLVKNEALWKLLFFGVLAALLYLTLMPQGIRLVELNHIDKAYHFIAFAGLSFSFRLAFREKDSIALILISIMIGVLIEIVQSYIPGRGFSYGDMLADAIGALAGTTLANKSKALARR